MPGARPAVRRSRRAGQAGVGTGWSRSRSMRSSSSRSGGPAAAWSSATARSTNPAAIELGDRLVEGLHAVVLVVAHELLEPVAAPPLDDGVGDGVVDDEHLGGRDLAPPAGPGEEPLADDAAQRAGDERPGRGLALGREEADEAVDGLGRAHGRESREDQVPVSAASSTRCAASSSVSSPTTMRSGCWRTTRASAAGTLVTSTPTSRWSTIDALSAWSTSMGSSMVTMWRRSFVFT